MCKCWLTRPTFAHESGVNRAPGEEPCIAPLDPPIAEVPEKFETLYRKDIFLAMFSKHIFTTSKASVEVAFVNDANLSFYYFCC